MFSSRTRPPMPCTSEANASAKSDASPPCSSSSPASRRAHQCAGSTARSASVPPSAPATAVHSASGRADLASVSCWRRPYFRRRPALPPRVSIARLKKHFLVHRRHSQQVEQQVDRANPARLILEASVHLTHEAARLLPPSVLNKRGGPSREVVQLADHLLL